MMSMDYYVSRPGTVIVFNNEVYAATHNDGEKIGVTPRMRKYFRARHLEDKKRYGLEAPETEFLKKVVSCI